MITHVNLITRLRQGTTGDAQVVGDPPSINSVTLSQTTDGTYQQVRFNVLHNDQHTGYTRDADAEVWTATFEDELAILVDRIIQDDLILPAERQVAVGVTGSADRPAPLDALLGPRPGVMCNNMMPTRRELIMRLGNALGVDIVLHDGPGLPNMDRKVLSDFVTANRQVGEILDELTVQTGARMWVRNGQLHIDGRAIPSGGLPRIPAAISITRSFIRGSRRPGLDPDPGGQPDPDADTFETRDDAEHSWVEHTIGADESDRQEIHFRLVKAGGDLVLEEERRYGYVQTTSGPQWVLTYHVRKEHEYLPYCRGALVRSVETVRQARTDMVFWTSRVSTITGITHVRNWAPDLILSSRKVVTQRWHAEGWLRLRTEVTEEAAGLVQSASGADTGDVAYKRTTRAEEWTPLGGGQWLQRVTEHIPTSRPVYEIQPDGGGYEVLTTYPIAKVNTFSRPTDGPPPQLTCDSLDARVACEDRSPEDVSDAIMTNDPDRLVFNVTLPGVAVNYRVGQMLTGAYVAGVRYTVTPDTAETEVELWVAV